MLLFAFDSEKLHREVEKGSKQILGVSFPHLKKNKVNNEPT